MKFEIEKLTTKLAKMAQPLAAQTGKRKTCAATTKAVVLATSPAMPATT